MFCLACASQKRHLSLKDYIYPTSLAFNEAKYGNGLAEPAHNRAVCEKAATSGRGVKCVECHLLIFIRGLHLN